LIVLATAVIGHAAHAAGATNPPTPFTNSGTLDFITFNDNLTHVGSVINTASAIINGTGALQGISVVGATVLQGDIVNNGLITSTSSPAFSIGGTVTGSVVNNGNVSVNGAGASDAFGIAFNGTVNGGIVNNGAFSVSSSGSHSSLLLQGSATGSFTNNGNISIVADPNIGVAFMSQANNVQFINNAGATITEVGAVVFGPVFIFGGTGGVVNNGTMTLTGNKGAIGIPIILCCGGTFSGGVINNGTINVTAPANTGGVIAPDLQLGNPGPDGIATASGTLTGQPAVPFGGTISGPIINNGQINVTGTNGGAAGLFLHGAGIVGTGTAPVTFTNTVANNGTLSITSTGGTGTGQTVGIMLNTIGLNSAQLIFAQGVSNGGTINVSAATGSAIGAEVNDHVTVVGGFTNTGTINATTAISTLNDSVPITINQAGGALNGAVVLSNTNADFFNISGGTVNGQVTGGLATTLNMTGGTLVVAPTFHSVVGTYIQTGGTVNFNVTPNTSSHGSITSSSAAIVGGTFNAVEGPGSYGQSQTYADVFIAPSRIGNFTATSQSPLFTASLIPGSAGGNLSLLLNYTGIPRIGLTANEAATASGLDSMFTSISNANALALFNAFLGLKTGQFAGALDLLSGEIHASTQSVLIEDSSFFRNAILDRLRQGSFAGSVGPMAALSSGGPVVAYADPASTRTT
jgi:hypothetical protein